MERCFIKLCISLQKPAILLAFVFMTASCGTTNLKSTPNCILKAQGHSAQAPCWVFKHDEKYIKVQGNKHLGSNGWLKAKQTLFKEAMLEIASRRYGEEVSINTLVIKAVSDSKNGVSSKSQVVREAHFNRGNKALKVKGNIIDYYYDTSIEKVWVLVEEK